MTESDPLARQLAIWPDATAVLGDDGPLTWAQFHARTETTAQRLIALGVRPGQRVAVPLATEAKSAQVLFAMCRIGAVLIPLDPNAPHAEHDALIGRAHADHFFTRKQIADTKPAGTIEPRAAAPHEPWCIVYTSGSTGKPKGTILTRENLESNAAGAEGALHLTPQDRWLACLPFHHVGGLSVFVRAARTGFPVLARKRFDATAAVDAIIEHRILVISLVPTMLHRMLEAGWSGERTPDVRAIIVGGGPAAPELIARARHADLPVAPTYGMTETSSMLTLLRPEPETYTEHGNAGYPIPGASVSVGERPAGETPPGSSGDIWVTGPMVADATVDGSIPRTDGWMRTGDIGTINADGSLTVIGRGDDVIVTGGEKVRPSEVEAALVQHPEVVEAVVVGVPDAEWGQRVVAFLVTTDGAPEDEALREWLKSSLAPAKCPKTFHRVPELPSTAIGKPDRAAMRVLAGGPPE